MKEASGVENQVPHKNKLSISSIQSMGFVAPSVVKYKNRSRIIFVMVEPSSEYGTVASFTKQNILDSLKETNT